MTYQIVWMGKDKRTQTYLNKSNSKVNNIRNRLKRERFVVSPVMKIDTGASLPMALKIPDGLPQPQFYKPYCSI